LPLPPFFEDALLKLSDAVFDRRYQPPPRPGRIRGCKIISHRGAHDGRGILENTLAAFDRAARAGVWGIELDVRWTKDREPVIFHDADLCRLFGRRHDLARLSLQRLQQRFPEIACLAEVIARWGKRVHLMIEVKQQPWPPPKEQARRLQEVLGPLAPVEDYHLLSLSPQGQPTLAWVPRQARVTVAAGWPAAHSRLALSGEWGGICGHYLLLTRAMITAHQAAGRMVGTGYPRSRNCLYRELHRGVDWIFSNHAVELQQIVAATAEAPR
jgi:glycerophosphoryl diester phosphodiesterase